jgi:hypothetical protein
MADQPRKKIKKSAPKESDSDSELVENSLILSKQEEGNEKQQEEQEEDNNVFFAQDSTLFRDLPDDLFWDPNKTVEQASCGGVNEHEEEECGR